MKLSFSILNEHVFCFFLEKEKLEEKKRERKRKIIVNLTFNEMQASGFFFSRK
jgi:hypothetical protein